MDKALLLKRLAQYNTMKSAQKKYNRKRWEQMKLARAMDAAGDLEREEPTQPRQ